MEYLETGEAGNQTKHKKSEFESLHPREKLGMLCTFDNLRTGAQIQEDSWGSDTGGFVGLRHRRIRGAQTQEDSWGSDTGGFLGTGIPASLAESACSN